MTCVRVASWRVWDHTSRTDKAWVLVWSALSVIASNLTIMAGLKTPIITVGMLSQGYFGVISSEGAASILGKYKDDAHQAAQFPKDCLELATAQSIYAYQLPKLGVGDEVILRIWQRPTTISRPESLLL